MTCPTCGHLNIPGTDECAKCHFALASLDAPAPSDRIERSLMTQAVALLDPRPPVTVGVGDDLGRAVRRMIDERVGALLVTDPAGNLVGILTERDFLTKAAGTPGFEGLPVAQFMTPRPEGVRKFDSLAFALGKMDTGGYRHLPVVDGGRPVGVISVRDIL
ncbi:MAG: CBS domain-containing protein, partial [Gemmataceae bacterium]|nr:CBS domain-containing protein [Gemmataceae bacterium]